MSCTVISCTCAEFERPYSGSKLICSDCQHSKASHRGPKRDKGKTRWDILEEEKRKKEKKRLEEKKILQKAAVPTGKSIARGAFAQAAKPAATKPVVKKKAAKPAPKPAPQPAKVAAVEETKAEAPVVVPDAPVVPVAPVMPVPELSESEMERVQAVLARCERALGALGIGFPDVCLAPVAPAMAFPVAAPVRKPAAAAKKGSGTKKAPVLEYRRGTHFCENYDNDSVEIASVKMSQSVCVFNGDNLVVKIPGKVKSVSINKCERTRVFVSEVVSTFDAINCERCHFFFEKKCPSISVDLSDGCVVHVLEEAFKDPPRIITSKTSEINVSIPGATSESDPIELPLPEQFVTRLEGGKLVTEPATHG